ncbi:MAG TPA: acyl-CoA dehydrogenase family protein [Dehalococcoidia bacterium]|jgi:alkylation response protein AidB-like acyl-CoA dehydrogenase|nr:acyl-CoA dehydrogenase family protein [Dehalococcoidia bacterium]
MEMTLGKEPHVQQLLADLYVQAQVGRLYGLRNYYTRVARKRGLGHEGSQSSLHGKTVGPNTAKALLQIFGPYALIKDPKWAPLRGELENQQRQGLVTHPGGTPEVQKLIMARRMGLSRTRGEAAETPPV